jgi:hypothetical protein
MAKLWAEGSACMLPRSAAQFLGKADSAGRLVFSNKLTCRREFSPTLGLTLLQHYLHSAYPTLQH